MRFSFQLNAGGFEIYDMERIEVLRGPQAALYGRNATGGLINMITKRPNLEGTEGYLEVEYGDYDHQRIEGAIGVPLTDNLAVRLAGMSLERDGYIENLAYGQIPGIDKDMDGRDLYAYRATVEWQISDHANLWVMYSKFNEDDNRVRITNQVCKTNPVPTLGCDPDAFGLQGTRPGSGTGTIFAGLAGAIVFGAADAASGLVFEFPRPADVGLREQHTDIEPIFQHQENIWAVGFEYAFDTAIVELNGGYQDFDFVSQQDYLMSVGPTMSPTVQNPTGLWPISAPSGGAGALFSGSNCNLLDDQAGLYGGCVTRMDDPTRMAFLDQVARSGEWWTVEGKVRTRFDGPVNLQLGATYSDFEKTGDWTVLGNALDLVSSYGVPALGYPRLYPGFTPHHRPSNHRDLVGIW